MNQLQATAAFIRARTTVDRMSTCHLTQNGMHPRSLILIALLWPIFSSAGGSTSSTFLQLEMAYYCLLSCTGSSNFHSNGPLLHHAVPRSPAHELPAYAHIPRTHGARITVTLALAPHCMCNLPATFTHVARCTPSRLWRMILLTQSYPRPRLPSALARTPHVQCWFWSRDVSRRRTKPDSSSQGKAGPTELTTATVPPRRIPFTRITRRPPPPVT
ncbi:hypothetical protein C8Q74DRAFT_98339 [Fomes fomentarius]|nr:hypothetical protein C8Q74DRAFT_98339 [Fomes fomentarius]